MNNLIFVPTGNPSLDRVLGRLIRLYEIGFPDRILSCCLTGSYAEGEATPNSDLDMTVVFRGDALPGEFERFHEVNRLCAQLTPVLLDISPIAETTVRQEAKASLKMGQVVAGEDILDSLPLEPLPRHLQRCIFLAVRALHVLRGQGEALPLPLNYPDAQGEFYGYERWGGYLGDNRFVPGLRIIVTEVTMIATVLVALHSGQQAGTKRQSLRLYRELIGGEWADFLDEMVRLCKTVWQYQIPQDAASRAQLRQLCERLLLLEQTFVETVRPVVLENLRSPDEPIQHFARESMQRIHF